ncbi:MAG: class I SAM-dependent methyltransferase [Candidatus Melainabacteria bacterium]|nr:MAG: class I SAM-dependent methyltransferase [Candidatus Melainabacteria bacterium]
MTVPIKAIEGVELDLIEGCLIAAARVVDETAKFKLSWDRFVRLKAAAESVKETAAVHLLDAGGYDGALALFLPNFKIDVIDPATTGGSVLAIPCDEASYDAVLAIDVLEHIEPEKRSQALTEFARVAKTHIILNYPCSNSKSAQELMLKLTNNALISEHVHWDLPDSDLIIKEMSRRGFRATVRPHSSLAVWLGQFVTLNLAPESAAELNKHLIENYSDEPFSQALYHLVICERES